MFLETCDEFVVYLQGAKISRARVIVMRRVVCNRLIWAIVTFAIVFAPKAASATGAGKIIGWGRNDAGQCDVPSPNTGFVAIAAGRDHSIGLKGIAGDISGNKEVDFFDYSILAERWLDTSCESPDDCNGADLEPDGDVDMADLEVIIDNWLAGK